MAKVQQTLAQSIRGSELTLTVKAASPTQARTNLYVDRDIQKSAPRTSSSSPPKRTPTSAPPSVLPLIGQEIPLTITHLTLHQTGVIDRAQVLPILPHGPPPRARNFEARDLFRELPFPRYNVTRYFGTGKFANPRPKQPLFYSDKSVYLCLRKLFTEDQPNTSPPPSPPRVSRADERRCCHKGPRTRRGKRSPTARESRNYATSRRVFPTRRQKLPPADRVKSERKVARTVKTRELDPHSFRDAVKTVAAKAATASLNVVEILTIFASQLAVATNWQQFCLCFLSMYKHFNPGTSVLVDFHKIFLDIFGRKFSTTPESEPREAHAQGFRDFVKTLRAMTTDLQSVVQSEFVKKINKMYLYVLCSSMAEPLGFTFSSQGFTALEAVSIRRAHSFTGVTFYSFILDTTCFILERGIQVFDTCDPRMFFHSDDSYAEFHASYEWIKTNSAYLANMTLADFTTSHFLTRCDEFAKNGREIVNRASSNKKGAEAVTINRMIVEINAIKAEFLLTTAAGKRRRCPFSMLLHGTAGVGKSSVTAKALGVIAAALGEPIGDEYVYVRSPVETHWNSFDPKMWAIILDDVASRSPNYSPNGDPSVMEIINLINSVCYSPDQASLEKKGKTPAIPRVVIATTNCKNLNAHLYFETESAARRRFPYIVTITVKEEFKMHGTDQLDPLLVQGYEALHDRVAEPWFYDVEKIEVRNGVIIERPLLTKVSCDEFYPWLAVAVKEQQAAETKLACAMHKAWDACKVCFKPNCICPKKVEGPGQELVAHGAGEYWDNYGVDDRPNFRDDFRPWGKGFFGLILHAMDYITAVIAMIFITGLCLPSFLSGGALFHVVFSMWQSPNWAWVSVRRFLAFSLMVMKMTYFIVRNVCYAISWNRETRAVAVMTFRSMWANKTDVLRMFFYVANWYDCCLKWYTIITRTAMRSYMTYTYTMIEPHYKGAVMSLQKFRKLGSEMGETFFRHPKLAAGLLAVLGAALATAYLTRPVISENEGVPQGTQFSTPAPLKKEKVNSYYNSDYERVSLPQCDALKVQDTFESACRTLQKSVFTLWVGSVRVCAVSIGGCDYLTVSHPFLNDQDEFKCRLKVSPDRAGVSQNVDDFILSRRCVFIDPESDRAVIRITQTPPRAHCDYIFSDRPLEGLNHPGVLIHRGGDGKVHQKQLLRASIHKGKDFYRAQGPNTDSRKFMATGQPIYQCISPPEEGMCGGLILIRSKSNGVTCAGIHVAGYEKDGYSVTVDRKFISAAREYLPGFAVATAGKIELSIPGKPVGLGPIHMKAPIRYQSEGTATVYGTTDLPRASPQSMVRPTLMSEAVRDIMELSSECVAPDLKTPRPKAIALKELLDPVDVNTGVVDICADALFERYKAGLSAEQLRTLKPYDMFTAINGHAGVAYVDAIKFSTSAGFPRNCPKSEFTSPDEPRESAPAPRKFDDSIMEEVEALRQCYASGERGNIVFRANLKDEAVSLEKKKIGKTRVFAGAPIAYTLLARQYFLSFVRLAQNNPKLFESAVGINATSSEWGKLRKHLTKFGLARMIAGDFKAYDKRIPANLLLAAFNVWIRLARLNSTATGFHPDGEPCYSYEDIIVMIGIATDTAFPLMDFFGEIIQFNGSNPSGHPLTVTKNGTCNSLYMRIVWFYAKPPEYTMADFDKFVTLMTYGDDNVLNVDAKIDFFNHTTIVEKLSQIGVTYTMPDKESESVPFVHMDDIDFLKRRFVVDENLDGYVQSPLDMSSIAKMLTVHVASKAVTPEEQCVDIIRSANREFFFHGKEVFDVRHAQLIRVAEASGLSPFFEGKQCLPGFDNIKGSIDAFQEKC